MLKNRRESIVKIGAGIAIGIMVSFGSIGIIHNVDSGGHHSANVTRMNVHASHHYEPRTFHKNIERKRFYLKGYDDNNSDGDASQDANHVAVTLDRAEKAYLASVTNLKDYTVSVTTFYDPPASAGGGEADQILTFNRKPNVPNAKIAN